MAFGGARRFGWVLAGARGWRALAAVSVAVGGFDGVEKGPGYVS